MKHLMTILMMSLLFGCTTNQNGSSMGSPDSGCELPELTGKSCVEPNHDEISKYPLGTSGHNPIRVNGPGGQRDYLSRLICPDGRVIKGFLRAGSVGVGPYGFMMDVYEVECSDKTYSVYMDMYHSEYTETRPVDGFTIKH